MKASHYRLGSVNPQNGNLHIEIPLRSFQERSSHASTYALVYDSSFWDPDQNVPRGWYPHNGARWRLVDTSSTGGSVSSITQSGRCPIDPQTRAPYQGTQTTHGSFVFTDSQGTAHVFDNAHGSFFTQQSNCTPAYVLASIPSGTQYAADGSGYFISVTNYTAYSIYGPDGVLNGREDTNGNYLGAPTYLGDLNRQTDSAGRTTPALPDASGSHAPNQSVPPPVSFTLGGAPYLLSYESVDVCTAFDTNSSGPYEFCTGSDLSKPGVYYNSAFTEPAALLLPDGRQYSFSYDSGLTPGHYGELTSVTLPSGGVITFAYSTSTADSNSGLQRRLSTVMAGQDVWNFTATAQASGFSVVATAPARKLITGGTVKDDTVYTFPGVGGSQRSISKYDGSSSSGKKLQTITKTFEWGGVKAPRPTSTIFTLA